MMDKWEQFVADRMAGKQVYSAGHPYTRQFGKIFLAALRQCEADTIRRCAEVVADEMGFDDVRTDTRVLSAVSRVEKAILSLLPQEATQ